MTKEFSTKQRNASRSSFTAPEQEQVHRLLGALISEGTAHLFEDACRLMHQEPVFHSTTHLAAHLCREVESSVRQSLREGRVMSTEMQASSNQVPRSTSTPKTGEKEGHSSDISAILSELDLSDDEVALRWYDFTEKSYGFSAAAHRDNLRFPRRLDDEFRKKFCLFVNVMSVVLSKAEIRYIHRLRKLKSLFNQHDPNNKPAKKLAQLLGPGVAASNYILNDLTAEWLAPLREAHVFSDPPKPKIEEDGWYSCPEWPQAAYLRRIAAQAPDEVTEIIEALQPTANDRVEAQLLRVGCN